MRDQYCGCGGLLFPRSSASNRKKKIKQKNNKERQKKELRQFLKTALKLS
jgi:hypothetical protein